LLDINTGESRILRADIVQDCGKSLNESIDIGQIEVVLSKVWDG